LRAHCHVLGGCEVLKGHGGSLLVVDEDREAYARTLRQAIVPDGLVILATFAPDGPSTCSGLPVRRYSADGLAEIFGGAFDVVESLREEHVTPRGSRQPFTWVAGRLRPT